MNKVEGNTLWQDTFNRELDSINKFQTFHVLEESEALPEGYTKIPYHLIFDCKFYDRRKACLDCDGHKTPDVPPEEGYSGVVSMDTIRLAFVLGSMNKLEVCAADISTAFLYGKIQEKVYIIAGKEFGKHAGKRLLVEGGIYGLKTSAACFHEELSSKLQKMGFKPSKTDFDLSIRPMGDHYEYLATCVDDLLVFSHKSMPIIEEIQKYFKLKGVGQQEYYLGGNFHSIKNIDSMKETGNDDPKHHLCTKWLKEGVKMTFST